LLWISCIKICKKVSVREVPQTGCIVSHGIDDTRDVGDFREISVVVPMEGKEAQEVCRTAVVGDGATLDPGYGRGVVAERSKGKLAAVSDVGEDILMAEDAGEFQVGVVDGAAGIREGHKVGLNGGRKRLTPYEW
jgi:hypothetical protein